MNQNYTPSTSSGLPLAYSSYFTIAIEAKQYEIAKMIFPNGQDINSFDIFIDYPGFPVIKTAIDFAIEYGDEEMKEWLIKKKRKHFMIFWIPKV